MILFLFFASVIIVRPNFILNSLVTTPWAALIALSFCLLFVSLFRQQFVLPKWIVHPIFIGLTLALFIASFINGSTFFEERWLQRYIFGVLFLACYQLFTTEEVLSENIRWPLACFVTFLSVESLYQFYFVCVAGPLGRSCASSRMGNINMLAQALALSLPFIYCFKNRAENAWQKWVFTGILVVATLAIINSYCRSAILSLIVTYVCQSYRWFNRKLVLALISIAVLALFVTVRMTGFELGGSSIQKRDFSEDKVGTIKSRIMMWDASLAMAKDHIFGIGENMFEYGFLPYKRSFPFHFNKKEIEKSPHNEIARVMVEDGIVSLIFVLGFFFILFSREINQLRGSGRPTLMLGFLLALAPEAIFQFPSEMWVPTLFFAWALCTHSREIFIFKRFSRAITVLALTCCLIFGFLFAIRNVQIVSARYSVGYCKLFPDNWRMCLNYFKSHYEDDAPTLAANTVYPVIKRQPFNYTALEYLFMVSDSVHRETIACNYFNLFEAEARIPGTDLSSCKITNREKLIQDFNVFANNLSYQ